MKRFVDILASAIALICLLPVLCIIAMTIAVTMGRPVIFRQKRPGLHGKPFVMLKLRTMRDALDENGVLLPDGLRITWLGHFLRTTSIDELPELWNVLRGEMSLVGPRPLLIEYLDLYTPHQARRHEVRPGITGWAQVNGRNAITWEEKFDLDVWYVDNCSFWLDMHILWMTLVTVIRRDGISQAGEATMRPFRGSGERQ